ncbi:MAG: pre-peptidase C-terminal domain-containing protein [Phototrophicaceae bacterium]
MMGATLLWALWMVGLWLQPDPTLDLEPLAYGETVSGFLDSNRLRDTYVFDGRRGEFVTLTLTPDGEDILDPTLTILAPDGLPLITLDDGVSAGTRIDALRITENGLYTVIVSRFGGALGSTFGDYDLQLERVGVSSESGSSLRYGDTILNTLTPENPQFFYSFPARRGDIINITMRRVNGDLDPLIRLLNTETQQIAVADDTPGGLTLDAEVRGWVIDSDGTYVIVASRYGELAGNSTGAFLLTLEESDASGLGNMLVTAATINYEDSAEGELTAARYEQFYTFNAAANDIVTIQMDRLSGSLDAYLVLLDENRREITADDDSGGGQNAQIIEARLPADGTYTILATRFNRDAGSTVGRFRITLNRVGGAFDEAMANANPIRYGSTVTGTINDDTPDELYVFYGNRGDLITASMNRGDGNLDPFISLLDDGQRTLVRDDDSGGGQNARIERYVLPASGLYYLRVSRYSGNEAPSDTRGSYILVLAQRTE